MEILDDTCLSMVHAGKKKDGFKQKKNWLHIKRLANEYTFMCFELEQNI